MERRLRWEWLACPKFLSSCGPDGGSQEREPGLVILRRERLEGRDDTSGGEAAGDEGAGVESGVTREGMAYRATAGVRRPEDGRSLEKP